MRGAINYLRGSVRVELECPYSERAVNICARHGVDFWDLERGEGGAARMTVSVAGYKKLRDVARETGVFTVRAVRRRGVPFLLWRIRKRYVLLAGMVLCLAAVTASAFFVWQIDVVGNETVPTSEILASLGKLGVKIGTSTLKISGERVANDMLLMVPELSWITLNTHGSRIEVIVREKIQKPEIIDWDEPASVVAEKSGIITAIEATDGWTCVAVGDTVEAGDELVSAYIPVGSGRLVHAEARVTARIWYEFSLCMPLEAAYKEYTGRETTHTAVILGGRRINFYFSAGSPYNYCDKMTKYDTIELSGGAVLPLTVVRDTFREYEPVSGALTVSEARDILSARLLGMLEEEIGDGSVTSTEFETVESGGVVTVTLRAECLEQIGAERALTDEEIAGYRAQGGGRGE